jgi:hypothetical protein
MAGTRFRCCSILAAALCAALPALAADQDYAPEFKLRAGLTAGTLHQDQGANQAYGFGVAVRHNYGPGTLNLELSYDILAGQALDKTPFGNTVYGPSGTGFAATQPSTGHPYFLRANESIDFRKESASGFSLKAGYGAPTGLVDGLNWQAGLSLDFYQTSSEFTGTLRPMYLAADGKTPVQASTSLGSYYEGIATVKKGSAIVPGVTVGLRQQLGKDFALELNLRNFGARHYDWRPTTYTGQATAMNESTHRGFLFEICLAMAI